MWERYIEHAIIAVAFLVMIWFAWGAFGTKISISNGPRILTADSVDAELVQSADKLKRDLRDGAPSTFKIQPVVSSGSSISSRMESSISPSENVLFPTIDMTADIDLNKDVQSELRHYVNPSIAAPEAVRTHQWFGTILESEMNKEEELQAMIAGPPHDTSWVQVAAKFDVDEVVATFSSGSEQFEAIPIQWYDGGADIFDIEIQRQMLGESGWLKSETVPVLPGHLTYRSGSSEVEIDMMERESIIRSLRGGRQEEIANPDFYRLKGVVPSSPDSPQSWDGEDTLEEDDGPRTELNRKTRRLENKIERQRRTISSLEDRIDKESRGGGGSGGGGGIGPGGGGGGGGSGTSKIDRLRNQLNKENDELIDLIEELDLLQEEIEALDTVDEDGEEVIMSGEVWVWGHDVTIQPGETYRYRMIIQLANPFFGHKPSLYEEQKSLAERVTIASAASEWSTPIVVQKPLQWFVVGATQSGKSISPNALDAGKISAEVFEFSDGAWSSNSVGIQVGQRLGLDKEDGFTSDWFVLDILEDTVGEVVLLQHIENGEVQMIRPKMHASSLELRQLRQQVRSQATSTEEEESEEEPDRPTPRPGGPMGGGGGGI